MLMIGAQGVIGWWMVKSGMLPKPSYQSAPRVSVYRIFVHLNAAMIIYGYALWHGLTLVRNPAEATWNIRNLKNMKSLRRYGLILVHLLALNISSGSIVAGIDAGKVFNTWPDMNGA